jgi:hypothetical protein
LVVDVVVENRANNGGNGATGATAGGGVDVDVDIDVDVETAVLAKAGETGLTGASLFFLRRKPAILHQKGRLLKKVER